MFVRFRESAYRLDLSLVEAVRRDGKPRHQHVASLGSIRQPPSTADRVTFWHKLYERLAELANRVDAEAYGKILGAARARVPMATAAEPHELQLANTRADAETSSWLSSAQELLADGNQGLASRAEQTVAASRGAAKESAEVAQAAKDKIERLERGEDLAGGLGQPMTYEEILVKAGFTKKDLRHMARIGSLTDEERFEGVVIENRRRAMARNVWFSRDDETLAATVAAYRINQRAKAL